MLLLLLLLLLLVHRLNCVVGLNSYEAEVKEKQSDGDEGRGDAFFTYKFTFIEKKIQKLMPKKCQEKHLYSYLLTC